MGKQELAEKVAFEKAVGVQGGFKSGLIATVKFVVAVLLLPLLVGVSRAFYQQLSAQSAGVRMYFFLGVVSYLALHLFLCELTKLNDAGQLLVGKVFSFFVPLRTLLYTCLPVYATLVFASYFAFKAHYGRAIETGHFIFLISFAATMHFIITASSLKKESIDVLKGNYFLSFSLLYLSSIALLSGFFYFMLDNFSFVAVMKEGFSYFVITLQLAWKQLFVLKVK